MRVERGSDAAVVIEVQVQGSSRWVSARDGTGGSARWVGSGGGRSEHVTWPIDTSRRGSYLVGPRTLEFAEPFGLRNRILAVRDLSPVLVVPRVFGVPAVPFAPREAEGSLIERPGFEQFHSVREYSTGDPMKLVHWKATARTGTLMVRRLVDTTTPTLLVVLDSLAPSYQATASAFDDYSPAVFENAVDLAASHAWQHAGPAHHVVVTTTGSGAAVVDVTARTRASALDWLAMVQSMDSGCTWVRITEILRRRPVSAIVCVTGPHAPAPPVAAWRAWAPTTVARAS